MEISKELIRNRIAGGLERVSSALPADAGDPPSQTLIVRELQSLLSIPDDVEFVLSAYWSILGRPADPGGLAAYLRLLSSPPASREGIIRALYDSPEAKANVDRSRLRGFEALADSPAGEIAIESEAEVPVSPEPIAEISALDWNELLRRLDLLAANADATQEVLLSSMRRIGREAEARAGSAAEENRQTRLQIDCLSAKSDAAQEQLLSAVQDVAAAAEIHAGKAIAASRETGQQIDQLRANSDSSQELLLNAVQQLGAAAEIHVGKATAASQETGQLIGQLGVKSDSAQELLLNAVRQIATAAEARASDAVAESRELRTQIDELRAEVRAIEAAQASAFARIRPPVIFNGADIMATEVNGFIIGMPAEEWRLGAYQVLRGPLEPGLAAFFARVLQPGMTFVDVGAHIGIYTLLAARQLGPTGRVYSFEPTPRTYAILRDNVQVNGFLESGNVELRQVALFDRAGKSKLTVLRRDSGNNSLYDPSADGSAPYGTERVTVRTEIFDEALKAASRIDYVKIDAEGAEPAILRGMVHSLRRHPKMRLVIEFGPRHLKRAGADPQAFLDGLRGQGFHVSAIGEPLGDVWDVPDEELLNHGTSNLLLSQAGSESGAVQ